MMRYILLAFSFLSVFWFPYPVTLILAFAASLFFPWAAVVVGLLSDLLYYSPKAAPFPYMALVGIFISVVAVFVRRFAKERILST